MLVVGDHTGPVTALTFTPDGSGLISAAKDGGVRLWDLRAGPSTTIAGRSGTIQSAAINPAGHVVATGHADGWVQLWRTNGDLIQSFGPFDMPIWGVCFLAGGQILAAALGNRLTDADAGSVQLWRIGDNTPLKPFNERTGVWAIAAAPEHKLVAWSTGARRVAFHDLTRPDPHVFPPLKKAATTLAVSPDAHWLAAGDDWSIRLWDIAHRADKSTLPGHKGRVLSLAFTPDGRHLLSGGGDQKIITWEIATSRQEHVVDWDLGRVTAVAVSPDGLLCAAGGDRGRVVVWDRDDI